ncbi:hypothetical protein Micbo1qcDRAFT_11302 [Microdochium bolleyi]|uniref:Uncharacterized protein n=1 Tax=Microdochium bolleyi TaxID=196109 RepID=A0A136IYB8_9PEZI|nr:hypothetical protein Micbo1qcDRAFT_11302 [Microdochium bolleyi]
MLAVVPRCVREEEASRAGDCVYKDRMPPSLKPLNVRIHASPPYRKAPRYHESSPSLNNHNHFSPPGTYAITQQPRGNPDTKDSSLGSLLAWTMNTHHGKGRRSLREGKIVIRSW